MAACTAACTAACMAACMAASWNTAETGTVPDSSARIWAILGGLLLLTLMIIALRWTFGTDRKVPTARLVIFWINQE